MWFAIAVVRNAFQIGWFVSERNEEREKEGKEFGWRTKIRFINRMGIGNGLKSRIIKQQQQWSENKGNGKTKRKTKNYFVDVINTSNANANAAQCEWIRAAFWYFYGYGWLVGECVCFFCTFLFVLILLFLVFVIRRKVACNWTWLVYFALCYAVTVEDEGPHSTHK